MDLNNIKELEKYIVENGIKGLTGIIEKRRYAAKKIKLEKVKIVDNTLLLDEFGQSMIRQYGEYYSGMPDYPNDDSICPQCGKGFTVDHVLHNKYVKHSLGYITEPGKEYATEKKEFYHINCNEYNKLQTQLNEFYDIFKVVYTDISFKNFKAIPNRYCPCNTCSPWFIVNTSDGDIEIGWRKRVINISWLDSYKDFTETFYDEGVTSGFGKHGDNDRFIHAWDKDKCIEYLKVARNSIKEDN